MLTTFLVIVEQSAMHLPLIIGAYITLSLLKVADLSIETAYTVGAIAGALTLTNTEHLLPTAMILVVVLLASACGGAIVGAISSMLTQKGNLPHLLSSIVTFGLFHGINQFIAPAYISLNNHFNPLLFSNYIAQHPELITIALISSIITILAYVLFNTQLGYAFAIYGDNRYFFTNYSISTQYIFIVGVMIANGLAGISGYLFAQSNNFVELNMGIGKGLFCITTLILGKSIASSYKAPTVLVPLLGVIIYFSLQQLLLKVGFNVTYFTAIQAVIVIAILLYSFNKKTCTITNSDLGL